MFEKTENLKAMNGMIQDECDEKLENGPENEFGICHQLVSKPEDGLCLSGKVANPPQSMAWCMEARYGS